MRQAVVIAGIILGLHGFVDSVMAQAYDSLSCGNALGLEATTGDPDSIFHLYGTGVGEFDPPDTSQAFGQVFDLYVTDGVVARWSIQDFSYFVRSVMDDDSTNADDIFPRVWDYFCYGDSDTTYAGIRYSFRGGVPVYTKIEVLPKI